MQTIDSTKKVIEILDKYLDKKTVVEILNKSKSLIFEANIPSYVYILMERFPNEFKQYN